MLFHLQNLAYYVCCTTPGKLARNPFQVLNAGQSVHA